MSEQSAQRASDGRQTRQVSPGAQRVLLVISWTVVGVPLLYAIWQTAGAIGPLFAGG